MKLLNRSIIMTTALFSLLLSLLFLSSPIEKVNAEQTTELIVNEADYEVAQGETVEFYVQGKSDDRTYDIDNPTIIGEKVNGYEVVGKRKIKFTKPGTYNFYIVFEGSREKVTVNVVKPETTKKATIKCADGIYTEDIIYKAEESDSYLTIESINKEYDIPTRNGIVYLAKDNNITPILEIYENGKITEADENWITYNTNEINILATLDELR